MSPLEWAASAAVLLNAVLVARRSMWNWPVGVLAVSLFFVVFVQARLYAATGLQVVFLALNLYGWWAWSRARAAQPELPVTRLRPAQSLATIAAIAALAAGIALLLVRTTQAVQPAWDAANTATALAAQFWQARRAVECWPLWLAVNIGSVGLYATQGLWVAAATYAALAVIAAFGWRQWARAS
jgi:nicotinamide mononucleotide transporter